MKSLQADKLQTLPGACLEKNTWPLMLELEMLSFITGGQEIQDECTRLLKEKGGRLSDGDVLISGSGRLPCKAILHAVGPLYQGGNKGEENCLHQTVLRCLSLAKNRGYVSIAIPAISCGIFHYPPAKATGVIVAAVMSFLDHHLECTVKDIYLCAIDAKIGQLFDEALHSCFSGLAASALPVQEAGESLAMSLSSSPRSR